MLATRPIGRFIALMTLTKGERTRERIVAAAAPLFNKRGYAGASMADLMAATGLEKGGIYRHFESKDDLALAALDHGLSLHRERIVSFVEAEHGAVARLAALARALVSLVEDPVLPGGCPLLNTAVESDDGKGPSYTALRRRARTGMRQLIAQARRSFELGITRGELATSVDAEAEAELFIATMEGALMLSKLYDDPRYLRRAAAHVAQRAEQLARQASP